MALVASCDVDQLCDRFVGLRMRQNLLRRAVHRLHPRFRRDSLRCSALSPQSQDENESRVSLLLGSIPSFTLFPGAVVGVEGTMNNRIISVTKLYSVLFLPPFSMQGFPLSAPKSLPSTLASETISLWVARGPFSCRDDGDFEPLKTLLALAKQEKPSLLLLVGFFGSIHRSADPSFPTPHRTFSIFLRPLLPLRSGRSSAVSISPRFSCPPSTTPSHSPRFRSRPMRTRRFRKLPAIPAC